MTNELTDLEAYEAEEKAWLIASGQIAADDRYSLSEWIPRNSAQVLLSEADLNDLYAAQGPIPTNDAYWKDGVREDI